MYIRCMKNDAIQNFKILGKFRYTEKHDQKTMTKDKFDILCQNLKVRMNEFM